MSTDPLNSIVGFLKGLQQATAPASQIQEHIRSIGARMPDVQSVVQKFLEQNRRIEYALHQVAKPSTKLFSGLARQFELMKVHRRCRLATSSYNAVSKDRGICAQPSKGPRAAYAILFYAME